MSANTVTVRFRHATPLAEAARARASAMPMPSHSITAAAAAEMRYIAGEGFRHCAAMAGRGRLHYAVMPPPAFSCPRQPRAGRLSHLIIDDFAEEDADVSGDAHDAASHARVKARVSFLALAIS